jgi:multidrug resistance efflux pump
MNQKQEKPSALALLARSTQRGLGADARREAQQASRNSATVPRPNAPEPLLEPAAQAFADDDVEEQTGSWDRHALANPGSTVYVPPEPEGSPELVPSVFDSRPLSRGPEYHPPSTPSVGRERVFLNGSGSGTFRLGTPASAQVPVKPTPNQPAVSIAAAHVGSADVSPEDTEEPPQREPPRPSSATVPPLERTAARGTPTPQRPWFGSKALLWAAASGLVLGTALALALVPVPVLAWGVLKATGTPQSLTANSSGSVAAVLVNTGDAVAPGDAVLQIQSTELQLNFENRRRELDSLRAEQNGAAQEEKVALTRNLLALERRRSIMGQRLALKDAEFAQRQTLLEDVKTLVQSGSTPATDLLETSAAMQATTEARLGIVDALSQLDIDVTDRRSAQQARDRDRRARLADAESRAREAEGALSVTVVKAPAAGWIESLRVAPGSLVQAGTELARLVPRAAPRTVVALVALDEAAGVVEGGDASVELTSPHTRDGRTLKARIKHVSREVAPPAQVEAVLGGPSRDGFVQLELELLDTPEYQSVEPTLRSGSRAIVNLVTPKRRLLSVVVEALRDWLPLQFRS